MIEYIDETDRKIVNILIKNGRTSYSDIAKAIGMKSPSVIERIKKLEGESIIKSYSVDIDYQKIGYDIVALIGLIIDKADNEEAFKLKAMDFDDSIVECYDVSGNYTMMLKVMTKNTKTLAKLLKKLKKEPGFQETNTTIVFSKLFEKRRSV